MADTIYEMKLLQKEISVKEEQELRRLWREAFEDEEAYLDFYHRYHLRRNRIWTLWDGECLVAMLHANPYQVQVNGTLLQSCFIVGIATDRRYRRKGCMGRLMNTALRAFQKEGMDFVYLIPQNELSYLPFGFQTVGEQHTWRRPIRHDELIRWQAEEGEQMLPMGLPGLPGTLSLPEYRKLPGIVPGGEQSGEQAEDIWCRETGGQIIRRQKDLPAEIKRELPEQVNLLEGELEGERLAEFANHWLKERVVSFTWRDAEYYHKRAAECKAMDGSLYVLQEDGQLSGVASMGRNGQFWMLYDPVGDDMLEALEESDEWEPVPEPKKIMLKWLGENNRLGTLLPFIMEELN